MYHYTESGLPSVYLHDGFDEHETEFGKAVSIHNLAGLHKAIGLDIVHKAPTLTGDEIRFLRKEMDLTQRVLAEGIKVSEDSVRGWENNRSNISPPADALLRLIYLAKMDGQPDVCAVLEELGKLGRELTRINRELAIEESDRRMDFEESGGAWVLAA